MYNIQIPCHKSCWASGRNLRAKGELQHPSSPFPPTPAGVSPRNQHHSELTHNTQAPPMNATVSHWSSCKHVQVFSLSHLDRCFGLLEVWSVSSELIYPRFCRFCWNLTSTATCQAVSSLQNTPQSLQMLKHYCAEGKKEHILWWMRVEE